MRVLVIAGMPGAGKEEFVQVGLSRGYDVVRMGDVVRAEAAKQGIGKDDKGVGGFASSERHIHGLDIWAERCVPFVTQERTIIDGSRGSQELGVFRKAFGDDVHLVAIHSSPRTRYPRLQARNRTDAPRTWEEFQERDQRELGWGLGNLIAVADVMLINEGTLQEFREQVRRFLEGNG
jgi:dephospho-CoA kinase